MIKPIIKHRCAMGRMPSDIASNHLSQLPYINERFDLFCLEAEEAGFEIEHWNYDDPDPRAHIHTLQVRPDNVLCVVTEGGRVKRIL